MKALFLLVLLVAVSAINAKAQWGLFLDHYDANRSAWTQMVIDGDPFTWHEVIVSQVSGPGDVKFSNTANGTYVDTLSVWVYTDETGYGESPLHIKGFALGQATIRSCMWVTTCYYNPDTFSVVNLANLEMLEINSDIDDDPNDAGTGKRIYPERLNPSDSTERKKVRIRATLSAAVDDVAVWFNSFDVDDPSGNAAPIDPDTGGANTGLDNRTAINKNGLLATVGNTGTTHSVTISSTSSGIAEADFTVSMHPGDNFRISASGNQTVASGIKVAGIDLVTAAGGALPSGIAAKTDMLTVWRKIHLEVDEMNAPNSNYLTGTVTSVDNTGSNSLLTIDPYPDDCERFNDAGSRMAITGMSSYNLAGCLGGGQIALMSKIKASTATGATFTMWDDDDYNNNNSPTNGDDSEPNVDSLSELTNLQTNDSQAANVFAPAYIMPVYDNGGASSPGTATFFANIATDSLTLAALASSAWQSKTNNRSDYWVSYIQVAYQPNLSDDVDPGLNEWGQDTNDLLGVTIGITTNSINQDCTGLPSGVGFSLIFMETLRDLHARESLSNDNLTAPHELGHQFGLGHSSGIMGFQNGDTFTNNHLHMLRCRVNSPAGIS